MIKQTLIQRIGTYIVTCNLKQIFSRGLLNSNDVLVIEDILNSLGKKELYERKIYENSLMEESDINRYNDFIAKISKDSLTLELRKILINPFANILKMSKLLKVFIDENSNLELKSTSVTYKKMIIIKISKADINKAISATNTITCIMGSMRVSSIKLSVLDKMILDRMSEISKLEVLFLNEVYVNHSDLQLYRKLKRSFLNDPFIMKYNEISLNKFNEDIPSLSDRMNDLYEEHKDSVSIIA